VEKGGTVYVHCKAGRGRAASAVMGFLIRYRLSTFLIRYRFAYQPFERPEGNEEDQAV